VNKEYELKLSLTPEVAEKLTKKKALNGVSKKRRRQKRLVSTYFDTPRHILRKSGMALRIRNDGRERTQTLKIGTSGPAGLQNHDEWSAVVDGDRPNFSHIADDELARSLARRRCEDRLNSVFTTDIERTSMLLKTPGAKVELAIDQGHIRAGKNGRHRTEPVCEAELELVSGDPASMLELALDLCETYDIQLAHRTKAERGYALARPSLRPRPAKARLRALDPAMTAGEAFDAVIRSALHHLFVNHEPTLKGHPEGVHQYRVAMRRLRAALRCFKKLLPYDKRKAFNGEFRWFQQRLGPARDWHVFLDETVPLVAKSRFGDDEDVERLRRIARTQRLRSTREGIELLESRRHARLILQFERWLAELREGADARRFDMPVQDFGRAVLRKTHGELVADKRALSRMPPDHLHELRKRGKKLRYASEFFSPLWPREEAKPLLKVLERLQNRLGEANDAAVARHILVTLGPQRVDHSAMRLMDEWSEARIANRIRKAMPHWRRLRAAEPFWEG
jgi:inorganic triphosphatase YgiF